jgi:hypothetical protein
MERKMHKGWRIGVLLTLGALLTCRAGAQPAPTWVKDFQKAREDAVSGNWDQAVPVFQRIVREVESVRLTRPLTAEENRVYQGSLDYLARFYLQQGRMSEARVYYITLLQVNPQYEFPDTPPPSVVSFFQQLRTSLIGFLSVSVKPPDAVLYLDQRRIGQGSLTQHPVLEGTYQLRVERPGYVPWQRIVTVKGGRLTDVEPIELQRVSSVLFVATAPRGAEVYLDGRRVGVTQGEAPPPVRAFAETRQWPPEEFSDYLAIPIGDAEEHYLEFRKPCYDTVQLIVRVPPLQDVFIDPVRLEPAVGRIALQADAEADVYIDGQLQGKASQGTFVACVGRHTVTLKNSWGTFTRDVDVVRGETVPVPASVVPRVVFLGWVVDEGIPEGVVQRVRSLVQRGVQRWDRAVWTDVAQADVPWDGSTVRGEDLARRVLATWEKDSPSALQTLLSRLARTLESRLFMVLRLRSRGDVPQVEVLLFSDMFPSPDWVRVEVLQEKALTETLAQMTYEAPVLRRTLPLRFVWTTLYDYPVIVAVHTGRLGPGDQPKPGDLLLSVEGLQLDRPDVWEAVEAALQTKEKVVIQFEDPLQPKIRIGEIPTVETPVEAAEDPRSAFSHRLAIGYLRYAERPEDTLVHQMARLNLARLYMRFQDCVQALEWLRRVQLDRPAGIGQATVEYRMAECYLQMGRLAEARSLLQKLQSARAATLGTDMGESVAEAARDALAALQGTGK